MQTLWFKCIIDSRIHDGVTSLGLLFLRVCLGSMMLCIHGLPKMFNFKLELKKIEDPFGFGARRTLILTLLQEVFLSLLIIFGFLTRVSVIPMIVTLIIAAFVVHRDWSIEKRQFILLYIVGFATLLFCGPGEISLDAPVSNFLINHF